MAPSWVRALVGLVAFVAVVVVGLERPGRSTRRPIRHGIPAGAARSSSSSRSRCSSASSATRGRVAPDQAARLDRLAVLDTRTIVLIPIAIAINIVLGQTVSAALKLPIYLDSIGTILVGVLAGPIAGAADRAPREPDLDLRAAGPVPLGFRGAVLIVAVEIGLLAGSSAASASSAAARTRRGRRSRSAAGSSSVLIVGG